MQRTPAKEHAPLLIFESKTASNANRQHMREGMWVKLSQFPLDAYVTDVKPSTVHCTNWRERFFVVSTFLAQLFNQHLPEVAIREATSAFRHISSDLQEQ